MTYFNKLTIELVKKLQQMVIWEVGNITPYDKGFAAGVDRAIEIILAHNQNGDSHE